MARTYDDSGMSGDSGSAGAVGDTHSNNIFDDMGFLNGDTPPLFVEYDLGADFALTNLVIWNDNEPTWFIQGMKEVTIEVRPQGDPSTVVFSGDIPLAPAMGAGVTTASLDVDLTGLVGRYIRITTAAAPNHTWRFASPPPMGGVTNDFGTGLSEVRVYGDPTGMTLSSNASMVAESRGFIGDTGSGWDTTSAVSIEASDERAIPSGGAWAGEAVFAINGNGVVGGGSSGASTEEGKHIANNWNFTGDESDDTHWMAVTPANYGANLHPAAPTGTILTLLFTFDQVYGLDELHIYNAMATGPPYMDTGIKEIEILVSAVNSSERGDWTSVAWNTGDGIVDMNPGTDDPYSVDEFVELDGADAQCVLLSVLSNHGAIWGTGAGEFRFYGAPKPPAESDKGAVILIR